MAQQTLDPLPNVLKKGERKKRHVGPSKGLPRLSQASPVSLHGTVLVTPNIFRNNVSTSEKSVARPQFILQYTSSLYCNAFSAPEP